ncbi:MAG: hypothetical protein KF886_25970 [Candidatus Hydrogenedentes bacterium]|nr:hypothetical protein [Candidatus Hydrogenedentota bacterium]
MLNKPHTTIAGALLALLLAAHAPLCKAEHFVPVRDMVIHGPGTPTEAELLAVRSFTGAVARITGAPLPQAWGGDVAVGEIPLRVGNATTLGARLESVDRSELPAGDADARRQSYVVAASPDGGILAAGLGEEEEARAFLGLGYALGDLLRRLDMRDGAWGFVLPEEPILAAPAMPNRTLYLMNSNHMNPGLSIEYFSEADIEAYVDFLVEARYSRVSLWQWTANMLYPGNFEENRARNQMTHRAMRHLFRYARQRGLHAYHQLAPMHANVKLLPDDPKFRATGYYAPNSICWAQPEARDLAKNMARLEMEYYGPVDGYIVWFYDPGGCFCDVCKPNQAQHLFEQFTMVHELSKTISPGAEFQAVLWPTWCFHEYTDRGIPYEDPEEVNAFVSDFLGKMRGAFGPREITIMDTAELEGSNIYNGLVDPAGFKRSAFLYSVMGLPSESVFPFASFKINEIARVMGRARDRGVEDANFFIQYANVNRPSVYAFGHVLYDRNTTAEAVLRGFAATEAAGEARELLYHVLDRLEAMQAAATYDAKETALGEVKTAWEALSAHPRYLGNREWLEGFVRSQQHYLGMARAASEVEFTDQLNTLKAKLAEIPMWEDFARRVLSPALAAGHIQTYWRGPLNDPNIVGLPK